MMFLPDVNVWIALAFQSHFHHATSRDWYEATNEPCSFCRLTQQGFLRLVTNPTVLKDDAVTLRKAWRLYDAIVSDPRVVFAEEPGAIERRWRTYTQRRTFSPKVWNDAYPRG